MNSKTKTFLRDLGNGLIMRRSSPEDADALSAFNGKIHREDDADEKRLINWTRDLLTRPHPTFNADDFIIIEESSTGRIVSSLSLIPQTWSYEGIEFGVGRPELVGTLPEYRGRGLVRAQFDEIHKWCAERGLIVQAITASLISIDSSDMKWHWIWMADVLDMRSGVPKLKDGETELFRFRPAVEGDIPFIMEVYERLITRSSIFALRDEAMWKYEFSGRSEESIPARKWEVIERVDGNELVGYIDTPTKWAGNYAMMYELKPGVSWLEVTPSVVRHLWNIARELTAQNDKSYPSLYVSSEGRIILCTK